MNVTDGTCSVCEGTGRGKLDETRDLACGPCLGTGRSLHSIVQQLRGDQNARAEALAALYPGKSSALLVLGGGEGIAALAGLIDPTFFVGLLSFVQQLGEQFGLQLQFVPRPGGGQRPKIITPYR